MTSEVAGALARPNAEDSGHSDDTIDSTAEPSVLIEQLVRAGDEIARLRAELDRERERNAGVDAVASISTIELEATRRTWSWRVTAPLRTVRRAQLERFGNGSAGARTRGRRDAGRPLDGRPVEVPSTGDAAFARRRAVAALWNRAATAALLLDGVDPGTDLPGVGGAEALAGYAAAVERWVDRGGCPRRSAWLTSLVALGRYPAPADVERARRVVGSGAEPLVRFVLDDFERVTALEGPRACRLHPVVGDTVVDLSTSLGSTDLAGIQRVVRSVIPRWAACHRFVVVAWDDDAAGFVAVTDERLQELTYGDTTAPPRRDPQRRGTRSPSLVVPWDCRYVVPELAVGSHERMAAMRALVTDGPLTSTAVVGYDLIPFTSSETVDRGFVGAFGDYLSVVKHATSVAAISRSAAEEFRTFANLLVSQGLDGPDVVACPLPEEARPSTAASRAGLRSMLGAADRPIVLVVGSHEPRKNHLAILAVAEQLWSEGLEFQLAFFGGLSWGSAEFESEVERLSAAGATMSVHRRVSEEELWAAYAEARFTVFPSLVEGYGLPVAESLSAGCPVLVSNYGSMSELAADGGALQVDPRDLESITGAARELLTDDALVARLRAEAAARPSSSWDAYAEQLWHALTDGRSPATAQEPSSPRRTAETTDV